MDLQTVVTKLNPNHFQHYKTFQDFISDIRLIFSNCVIYNAVSFKVLLLPYTTLLPIWLKSGKSCKLEIYLWFSFL